MIEKTLYGQHHDRVHALWERACLGLKCRHKWHRRRGWHTHGTHPTDEVYNALYAQCYKYHNLLEYLKRDEMLLLRPHHQQVLRKGVICLIRGYYEHTRCLMSNSTTTLTMIENRREGFGI